MALTRKEIARRWRERNNPKLYQKEWYKKQKEGLTNWYIKKLLANKIKNPSLEIIRFKREELKNKSLVL